ncbi:hypothetical protein MAF45_05180 [Mesosutterella sp. OilRF-GAM-744-9]|uniref:Uncharacterized protein n=1 Tax=Mesosutterella porci TaxID=2915351 RepID=A0ABS9MQE3_9BURK|nr:hypothetical protein [Mesosutterella sp. oilRF-744-WT-GAM-9]MCG5030836.1 hypothetical protein [Mesosutterella sp. oilRF-744-WT-GAM-9]
MITLNRLLPPGSAPAPVLLARMKKIPLTFSQRLDLPAEFEAAGESYKVMAPDMRVLEVGDIFMDEKGAMYAVDAAPEAVYHVTGDHTMLEQAAAALMMRGFRVMQTEDGFGVAADEALGAALKQIGLACAEVTEPFTPVIPCCGHHHHDGCCCGHHHDEDEECGCGHHHHHDGDEDECCCGGHHHDEDGECGCGHHHHGEGEEGECCCGGHHHDEDGECGCGHHHHGEGEEGECCCGGHHRDEDGECGCGHHHHGEGEEGECCCGGHHHDEKGCCGHSGEKA